MRFRIAEKIWLSLAALVAGYLMTIGTVFLYGLEEERRLDLLAGATFQCAQWSQAALAAFEAQIQAYENAVVTGQTALVDTASEDAQRAETALDGIGRLGGGGAAEAREAARELRAYTASAEELYRAMAANAADARVSARAPDLYRRAQAARARLGALAGKLSKGLQADLSRLASASRSRRKVLAGAMAAVLGLSVFTVRWATRRFIICPVADMGETLRSIAAGGADLTRRLQASADDEIGELASGFNQFVGRLALIVERLKKLSQNLLDAAEKIGASSREVVSGAANQADLLASSSSTVRAIQESVDGIARSAAELFEASTRSSSATQQMSATNEDIASQMEQLFARVDEVSDSIDELSAGTQQIAAFVSQVEVSASQTSEAVASLDEKVANILASADAASRFSESAARDAEVGRRAVESTVSGISELKAVAERSEEVIADLGSRAVAIGSILSVIDEVAEQTNLLALNAAILAAQAGEHGRGFAVVADEIRDLAERTGSSTHEISSIIEGLQRVAREAVTTMGAGRERVDQEAELAREAGAALEEIHARSVESLEQSRRIALAAQDQARASREAKLAVEHIVGMIKEVTSGASQQRDSAALVSHSARAMREIAANVKSGTSEQALASGEIADRLERIRVMTEHILGASQDQASRSRELLEATSQTQRIADANSRKASGMDRVVETLVLESDALVQEIGTFKV